MKKAKTQRALHRLLAAALCICVACGTAFGAASTAFAEDVVYVVTFDDDGGGGVSMLDNPMKTAIDEALKNQNVENATTLRLEGDATSITGYNQKYLLSLFLADRTQDFPRLRALDYSGLSSLLSISNEYNDAATMRYLEKVILPNSLTEIGDSAFKNCTSLNEIIIPGTVETIGPSAFYSCTQFTELEIPPSVTTIGDNAFNDCTALEEIRFYGNTPPANIGNYAFSASFGGVIKHPSNATGYNQNWLVYIGLSVARLEPLEGGGGTDSGGGGSVNAADYIHEVIILDNYDMKNDGSGKYIEGETVTIYAAYRQDYAFTGWEKISGGGILDNPKDAMTDFSMPDGDVVLKPTWRPWGSSKDDPFGGNTLPSNPGPSTPVINPDSKPRYPQFPTGSSEFDYTLTFDPAGGIMSTTQLLLKAGETPSGVPDPTRDGYTFGDWYNGDERVRLDRFTMPQADVTLTARWIKSSASSQPAPVDGAASSEPTSSEPTLGEPHSESPPSMGILLLVLLPIVAIAAFTILKKRGQNAEK